MDNPLEDALGHEPEVEDPHVEAPAEPAPPAPPAPPEPGHVPISAMLDEREKRQAAEKANRALQERLAAQQPSEPPAPDDVFEARLHAQNLRISRKFAEREYGPELMATVHDWAVARCDTDPFFNAQMRSSDDPYGAAFQAYNREQITAKVTPERLAAFEAWEQAQAEVQAGSPVSPPQPSAPTPPRTLADAPGTGSRGKAPPPVEEGKGVAFSALFPERTP